MELNPQRVIAILFVVALIFIGGTTARDAVAWRLWVNFKNPEYALAFNRKDVSLPISIGNYYFNNGAYNLDIAEKAYLKAVAIDPKVLWGHYQLARIAFTDGDFVIALEEINKELEINPQNLRSLYVRGLIYGYLYELQKAEDDFRRFSEWVPAEWAGYNDLAWILQKERKYAEAMAVVQKGIQRATNGGSNPWLWNALGVAQLNLEKFSDAEQSFTQAARFAETLTDTDWKKAYPGNNPSSADSGLAAFKSAIQLNLKKARESVSKQL
jgi:Tfp pilus assembly protein PilF